jgi:dihydrodipicolinate synthase/N-acetylneuraminate lyase
MAQHNWSGIHIPIITPFRDDASIDEDGLRRLVDYLIEVQKADSLVPCGTTGESPTLSHQEHNRVIELVIAAAAGRVPVIAGSGSNSTREAIEMTKHAEQAGAAASLQVCPYYNKPVQHSRPHRAPHRGQDAAGAGPPRQHHRGQRRRRQSQPDHGAAGRHPPHGQEVLRALR